MLLDVYENKNLLNLFLLLPGWLRAFNPKCMTNAFTFPTKKDEVVTATT